MQGNRIKKNGVILRRSDARRAQVAGIAQPKNPVECRNDVRSCLMILPGLTGSFDSVPPRLRPRSTALRMTSFFDAIALRTDAALVPRATFRYAAGRWPIPPYPPTQQTGVH